MKPSTFICTSCSKEYWKWCGQCSNCNEWNCIEEKIFVENDDLDSYSRLKNIRNKAIEYIHFECKLLNNLFDNGLVKGATYLIYGEPGVGKSSFSYSLMRKIPNSYVAKTLFVCGEESIEQVVARLKLKDKKIDEAIFTEVTNLASIIKIVKKENIDILFIDSIQMLTNDNVDSIGDKNVIAELINFCKKKKISLFQVSQITKQGEISGTKYVEHLSDGVIKICTINEQKKISFTKNRFGSCKRSLRAEFKEEEFVLLE